MGDKHKSNSVIINFSRELEKVDGKAILSKISEVSNHISQIVKENKVTTAIQSTQPLPSGVNIRPILENLNVEVISLKEDRIKRRKEIQHIGMGISGADMALADTGTIIVNTDREFDRWVTLLPDIYVAILDSNKIARTLRDLSSSFLDSELSNGVKTLSLITGPSRTADLELTLVKGVHGPIRVYVIILVD